MQIPLKMRENYVCDMSSNRIALTFLKRQFWVNTFVKIDLTEAVCQTAVKLIYAAQLMIPQLIGSTQHQNASMTIKLMHTVQSDGLNIEKFPKITIVMLVMLNRFIYCICKPCYSDKA